jgi:hypothetical protein
MRPVALVRQQLELLDTEAGTWRERLQLFQPL